MKRVLITIIAFVQLSCLSCFASSEWEQFGPEEVNKLTRPPGVFKQTLKSYPLEAAYFYAAQGVVLSSMLLTGMNKDPLAVEQFLNRPFEPVAHLSFFAFMLTNRAVAHQFQYLFERQIVVDPKGQLKVNAARFRLNPRVKNLLAPLIPFIGMGVGLFSSHFVSDILNDQNMRTCAAEMIAGKDKRQACATAYDEWVVKGRISRTVPDLTTLFLASIIAGEVYGQAVKGKLAFKIKRIRGYSLKKSIHIAKRVSMKAVKLPAWGVKAGFGGPASKLTQFSFFLLADELLRAKLDIPLKTALYEGRLAKVNFGILSDIKGEIKQAISNYRREHGGELVWRPVGEREINLWELLKNDRAESMLLFPLLYMGAGIHYFIDQKPHIPLSSLIKEYRFESQKYRDSLFSHAEMYYGNWLRKIIDFDFHYNSTFRFYAQLIHYTHLKRVDPEGFNPLKESNSFYGIKWNPADRQLVELWFEEIGMVAEVNENYLNKICLDPFSYSPRSPIQKPICKRIRELQLQHAQKTGQWLEKRLKSSESIIFPTMGKKSDHQKALSAVAKFLQKMTERDVGLAVEAITLKVNQINWFKRTHATYDSFRDPIWNSLQKRLAGWKDLTFKEMLITSKEDIIRALVLDDELEDFKLKKERKRFIPPRVLMPGVSYVMWLNYENSTISQAIRSDDLYDKQRHDSYAHSLLDAFFCGVDPAKESVVINQSQFKAEFHPPRVVPQKLRCHNKDISELLAMMDGQVSDQLLEKFESWWQQVAEEPYRDLLEEVQHQFKHDFVRDTYIPTYQDLPFLAELVGGVPVRDVLLEEMDFYFSILSSFYDHKKMVEGDEMGWMGLSIITDKFKRAMKGATLIEEGRDKRDQFEDLRNFLGWNLSEFTYYIEQISAEELIGPFGQLAAHEESQRKKLHQYLGLRGDESRDQLVHLLGQRWSKIRSNGVLIDPMERKRIALRHDEVLAQDSISDQVLHDLVYFTQKMEEGIIYNIAKVNKGQWDGQEREIFLTCVNGIGSLISYFQNVYERLHLALD